MATVLTLGRLRMVPTTQTLLPLLFLWSQAFSPGLHCIATEDFDESNAPSRSRCVPIP